MPPNQRKHPTAPIGARYRQRFVTTKPKCEHIILNEEKVPIIVRTQMKVIELILDKIAHGWSPEELKYQHPHLTLGQIYSALAYYSEHHEQLDQEIERQLKQVDQMRKAAEPTPLLARLKAKKLI